MTESSGLRPLLQGVNKHEYNIVDLDDEIRVDQLCVGLLRHFNLHLTRHDGLAPEQAGEICLGADYFLREFIIADRHLNLFEIEAERIRQFAGHWYITRTTEPNLTELSSILKGTADFYAYLSQQELVEASVADEIADQCKTLDYYQQRIDDFWAIEGEGFDEWRQSCPLEPVPDIS